MIKGKSSQEQREKIRVFTNEKNKSKRKKKELIKSINWMKRIDRTIGIKGLWNKLNYFYRIGVEDRWAHFRSRYSW